MTQLSLFSADLAEPRPADLGGLLAAHGQIARSGPRARLSILLDERWRAEALLRECRVRDIDAEIVAVSDTVANQGRRDGVAGPVSGAWSEQSGAVSDTVANRGARSDADVTVAGPVSGALYQSQREQSGTAGDTARGDGGRPAPVLLRTDRLVELGWVADEWTRGAVKAVPPGLSLGAGLLRCWTLAAGRHADPLGAGFLLGLDAHAAHTHEPLAAACSRAGMAGSIIGVRAGGPAVRVVGHRRMMRLAELLGTAPPDAPPGAFPTPKR